MPLRPCLTCGVLTSGSYCPAHAPVRASRQTRGRGGGTKAAAFREQVLQAAGHRCEVIERGVRCPVTDPAMLEAHHVVPVARGGSATDPGNGRCVCRAHHRRVEA